MIRTKYLLLLLGCIPALALTQTVDYTESMLYSDIGVTVQQADFSQLNTATDGLYAPMDDWMVNYLLGLTFVKKKAEVGLFLNFNRQPFREKDPGESSFKGSGIGMKYAWHLIRKKHFFIFPEISIGRRVFNLVLTDAPDELTVETVLDDEIQNYSFRKVSPYIDLGGGMDIFFKVANIYIGLGLSAGYQFDFGQWKYQGINTMTGGMGDFSGTYASFNVKLARDQR